jgi:hypothetical protein
MTMETICQWKDVRVAGSVAQPAAAADWTLWQYDGYPSGGVTPGSTYTNPTNATAGSLKQADPAGGNQKWLHALAVSGPAVGALVTLYDRLLHIGSLSGTAGGAQNINTGSPATLTRTYYDVGDSAAHDSGTANCGNEIWLEINTLIGTTGQTVTCSYTNESSSSKTTQAVTIGGTGFREVQRMIKLPLAAGDRGVTSVTSITLSGSTGTAGNISLVVARPLVSLVVAPNTPEIFAAVMDGDIEIQPGACLFWGANFLPTPSASLPLLVAQFVMLEK